MATINRRVLAFFSETDMEVYNNTKEAADDTMIDENEIRNAAAQNKSIYGIKFMFSRSSARGQNAKTNAKPILQFDKNKNLIAEYRSEYEAFITTGIGNIYRCLKGQLKTAGGYIWVYK